MAIERTPEDVERFRRNMAEIEAGLLDRFTLESRDVYRETGLTPRQLADQRAELLAAWNRVRESMGDAKRGGIYTVRWELVRDMDAAIQRAEGKEA